MVMSRVSVGLTRSTINPMLTCNSQNKGAKNNVQMVVTPFGADRATPLKGCCMPGVLFSILSRRQGEPPGCAVAWWPESCRRWFASFEPRMSGELRPLVARLSKGAVPLLRTLSESAIIYSFSRSPRRSLGLLVSHKGVGIEASAHLQHRKAERVPDDSRSDAVQGGVVGCGPFSTGDLDLGCETYVERCCLPLAH